MQENNGRFFRRANNRAVSFSDGNLLIDGNEVIRTIGSRYVPNEANTFQDSGRHLSKSDNTTASERLAKIARLLNEGRQFEAVMIASSTCFLKDDAAVELQKANFNPAEPRQSGKWSKDSSAPDARASIDDVQYRGYFHDVVVEDLLKGLKSNGSVVLKNVHVLGLNETLAIPDGASLPKGRALPYFIEVKTGNDPKFTTNQDQVYPLICTGGHATSFDPRISLLGLVPGVPFPPLDILLVHTFGPGLPLRYESYCQEFGFWRNPNGH